MSFRLVNLPVLIVMAFFCAPAAAQERSAEYEKALQAQEEKKYTEGSSEEGVL